jgi:hypothetical protein
MKTRREFVRLTTAAGVLTALNRNPACTVAYAAEARTTLQERVYWCGVARRLASPMLTALAERKLKTVMPVEAHPTSRDRPQYTYLEGVGRLLAGLAPWFELGDDGTPEGKERGRFSALARAGIDAATDPASPDFMNFSKGRQPLVDAAFLAQAMLRAPNELWRKLDARVQKNVVAAMVSSRPIQAGENNWKLFATTVEVFLHCAGAKRDDARLFEGLRKHREWYVGDGMYGDGPEFHWDYYNSFVIQPMLVEALDVVASEGAEWASLREKAIERLALRGDSGTFDCARWIVSGNRPVDRISRRCVPGTGAGGVAQDSSEGDKCGTGTRGADRGDSADDGGARHVRCKGLAHDWIGGTPTGAGRNLYLHRQRLPVQRCVAPAGIARERSVLERSGREDDMGENLVRRKSAGRQGDQESAVRSGEIAHGTHGRHGKEWRIRAF